MTKESIKKGIAAIPEGTYHMRKRIRNWNNKEVRGEMLVENGKFIVLKGSVLSPIRGGGWTTTKILDKKRKTVLIENDVLQEDVEFKSPSMAASFITWMPTSGWQVWKTKDGRGIDVFRKGL